MPKKLLTLIIAVATVLSLFATNALATSTASPYTFPSRAATNNATLQVAPGQAVHTVAATRFTLNGSGFPPNLTGASFTMFKDGQPLVEGAVPLPQGVATDASGNFSATFIWAPPQAGIYTLIARVGSRQAYATLTATNPSGFNLINGSQLEVLQVGVNELAIGPDHVHFVQYYSGNNYHSEFVYTVYLDGQLASDTVTNQPFIKLASGKVAIPTAGLGNELVKIVAYKLSDQHNPAAKPAHERTFLVPVDGWQVTLQQNQLTVNQAQELTLTVKDAIGKPVNNARIEIDGQQVHNPGLANIQSGTYSFKDITMTNVGPKTIKVYQDTRLMASLELNIVGQPLYQVQSNVPTLLQGHTEEVELTVTHDGQNVVPDRIRWIYADGSSSGSAPLRYLGDGVSRVRINPEQSGQLYVRAENADGTLYGEVALNVVAPQLVFATNQPLNLTDNFRTQVRFQVVDPRHNRPLTANLEPVAHHLADFNLFNARGNAIHNTITGTAEHVLTVLPQADWDATAQHKEEPSLAFRLNGALVDGVLPVKAATLTCTPDRILIGANNNLTLTYRDANDSPLANREVSVDGRRLGRTDDQGQLIYPVSIASTATQILAATDVASAKTSLHIGLAFDSEAPQLSYTVNDNQVSFKITDDIRIVRINIDDEAVDFWPGPSYEFTHTLQPGTNSIRVKAQDLNNNVLDRTVEITYRPQPQAIVLRGDQVMRQGDVIFVQARQFRDLGAQFTWSANSRTATFTLGKTKAEVTIGSLIGSVRGTPVAMPAAPFLVGDRTYIPLRFVSEALGLQVHWASGDVITISNK